MWRQNNDLSTEFSYSACGQCCRKAPLAGEQRFCWCGHEIRPFFFALLVDTVRIEFILFPVNTPPEITQDITLELLADSLRDKFKVDSTMNVSFFFLKNEHAPGLTPHLRPWLWPELIKWKLFNHNWRSSGQHQWWLSLTCNWGQFETELMFALGTGLSTQNKWSELPEWDLKIADYLNSFCFFKKKHHYVD